MNTEKQLIGAYGCIINSKQEVLLIKRADHDTRPGIWEMPGGGVEFGELIESAVRREVAEETGLDVNVLYPLATITGRSSSHADAQTTRIAYLCSQRKTQHVTLSPDHSEYQWVPLLLISDLTVSNLTQKVFSQFQSYPELLPNR